MHSVRVVTGDVAAHDQPGDLGRGWRHRPPHVDPLPGLDHDPQSADTGRHGDGRRCARGDRRRIGLRHFPGILDGLVADDDLVDLEAPVQDVQQHRLAGREVHDRRGEVVVARHDVDRAGLARGAGGDRRCRRPDHREQAATSNAAATAATERDAIGRPGARRDDIPRSVGSQPDWPSSAAGAGAETQLTTAFPGGTQRRADGRLSRPRGIRRETNGPRRRWRRHSPGRPPLPPARSRHEDGARQALQRAPMRSGSVPALRNPSFRRRTGLTVPRSVPDRPYLPRIFEGGTAPDRAALGCVDARRRAPDRSARHARRHP